ncbi:unnamed protein product [Closterium sp. NIES-65]|nr:unnamed protein product [Closterium sp. NIES-65]
MKTFAEQATEWLEDFDNPEGCVAYARVLAVSALAEHVDSVVGDAKKGLEEYVSNHLASAQVNIATAVTARLAVPPPPPPHPTPPAIPEELLKSFKVDIMKAVTEATQQSFRTGDGDDKESSKRSKGADGSRGSKPAQQSVVDQLKTKAGWKVVRTSHSKGGGSGGAEGGPADGVAANVAAPTGPPLVAEQTHPQASGGKGVTDKEVPTAQAANDGDSGTTKGPSVAAAAKPASATVAGTTKSSPRNPLAATSTPAGQSGANKDGEAAPASASPAAAKGVAKAASAKGDAVASAKAPPGGTALSEMLRRMEAHSRDVQQHPVVEAGLLGTARRSVTTQVANKSSGAPPAAPPVAAPSPAGPKSAFLRTHLGSNRYIGKSREKMELAYEHAITFVVYDGYVSKVLMKELTVLKPGELDKWKEVWAEVKFLPTGMWTVMWARGLCHPRARFDDIPGRYRGYASLGDALHDVFWPAIWFPIIEDTEEGKEETDALMSAMVNRVSICAAYGKVAASAAFGKVDASVEGKADEKTESGTQALAASACAIWCFLETRASVLGAVGKGKAAAMVAGVGEARAEDFKEVMHAVIDIARTRQAPAGEVAHNVAPSLQSQAVARAFAKGVEEVEADMIARATVETLAFWGMCPVTGPKLKAQGIDLPCDARMEYDMDHRGRKGEKVKQSKGSSKRKKGKQGKGSTDA